LNVGFTLRRETRAIVDHQSDLNFYRFVCQFFAYGQGASRFHALGAGDGFRNSLGFHLRLPIYALPEIVGRGFRRGGALAGLLLLWEVSTFAGFLAGSARPVPRAPGAAKPTLSKVIK
jgi:hypothetical protein